MLPIIYHHPGNECISEITIHHGSIIGNDLSRVTFASLAHITKYSTMYGVCLCVLRGGGGAACGGNERREIM